MLVNVKMSCTGAVMGAEETRLQITNPVTIANSFIISHF